MIKAIIFDFDGTLSNRQVNAYTLFKDYFKPFFKDLDDMEYEAVLQDLLTMDCNGTVGINYRMAPFIDRYNKYFKQEDYDAFYEFYYEYMWKYAVLKKDTLDVLSKLRPDYKLGILSNGPSKSQHNKITHCELDDKFDEILVTGDIGIHKPNVEPFLEIAKRLECKPEECMFVGDVFASDIIGAIRAKMTPVWVVGDYERPSSYTGYRIKMLPELLDILKEINEKN